jgi:hypothetical protein
MYVSIILLPIPFHKQTSQLAGKGPAWVSRGCSLARLPTTTVKTRNPKIMQREKSNARQVIPVSSQPFMTPSVRPSQQNPSLKRDIQSPTQPSPAGSCHGMEGELLMSSPGWPFIREMKMQKKEKKKK